MNYFDNIPRLSLGQFPTPLHRLDNISRELGTNVWIKRDDMTGIGLGGNKVRKLEFLLADAKAKGAEIIFTTGGAQSNHAMLTACCANKIGMRAILLLKNEGVTDRKGNVLLEHLMGTEVHFLNVESFKEIYAKMDRMGKELGRPYYKIPLGGSDPLGSLGYVKCMEEISEQAAALGVKFDHMVCAEGSGGTHAGVNLGARLFMLETKVHGMMVSPDPFDRITPKIERGTAELLGLDVSIADDELDHRDCSGPGYAIPSEEGNAAIKLMAEKEGLFLDPVYTGKSFSGLIAMAREGAFKPDDNVLYLYTGGAGGLFAIDVE